MKQSKKSLILCVVSLLLSFSMAVGGTVAWFTDSVTSGSNVIKTGSLDIDVQYTLDGEKWANLDGASNLFPKGHWEPGHTEVVALKITNKGSLALQYQAGMNIANEIVGKNKAGGDIVLSEILEVSTLVQPADDVGERDLALAFTGENSIAYRNTSSFMNANIFHNNQGLLPGNSHYAIIKVDMPETVGNEANHDGVNIPAIEFGVNVLATQYAYESDSFGNSYDMNATFGLFADTNILASSTKTLSDGADYIDFALYSKGTRIVKLTVPASAIADTSKPVKATVVGIDPSENVIVDKNTQAYAYDIEVTNLKANLTGNQLVTVVVAAPNALAAMKAYHNGKLIENAIYDEVAGTITFKTASFSPFEFTTQEYEVSDLAVLREKMQIEGAYIKLAADITVDLSKGSDNNRNNTHAYVGANSTYYNGVVIAAKNVALDLNGHSITVSCGDAYNSNSDVGALFFIGKEGSLNITNTGAVETGFIKMESSIYAVWAPFDDPSYVDIYGGAFIADSYAGDPIGTSTAPDSFDGTMQNENSNRALIYAGFGGNINVYGGYFLYNNTPNDVKNRNNGAFNAKDFYEGSKPLLTIHEGVMLINKEYRQNPQNTSQPHGSYDNNSVKLVDDTLYKISDALTIKVKIDGEEYNTWYQVVRQFKYQIIFKDAAGKTLDTQYIWDKDGEVTVDSIDDTAHGKLEGDYITDFGGWVNTASEEIKTIPSTNTTDIVLYPKLTQKVTVRWVDEDGNVIESVTTKSGTTYNQLMGAPEKSESKYDNMTFHHWEIRETDGSYTEVSSNYQITKDITLYPYYTYDGGEGAIRLEGHDDNGDGRYDRYTVEAAAGLNNVITIPGVVNGVPVTVITDLSSEWNNDGIKSIIIKEGVQEINSNAFAMTSSLKNVEIPASVTSIGANAFASTVGGTLISKKLTITYHGTWEEWQNIQKAKNWERGLVTGTTVVCTNGTATLKAKEYVIYSDYTWTFVEN